MKKLVLFVLSSLCCATLFGQAKKPTLMVVPSDVWCNQNGYVTHFNNQGTDQVVPDYKKALQSDMNLKLAITSIGGMMADRGFPLKSLEQELRKIEVQTAEDNMTTSNQGSDIAESPMDQLRRRAGADILIELSWSVNTTGPKTSVTYVLSGLDAYTSKQVASANGTGEPSFSAEIPQLLEEAVVSNMDLFTDRLQQHFEDMMENGREISLLIRVFDNGSGRHIDWETPAGDELGEVIDNWVNQNTVNHRYSLSDQTSNSMVFEQVRIPLYDEKGKALDARAFAQALRKYLKTNFQIDSKNVSTGLGQAKLILNEK